MWHRPTFERWTTHKTTIIIIYSTDNYQVSFWHFSSFRVTLTTTLGSVRIGLFFLWFRVIHEIGMTICCPRFSGSGSLDVSLCGDEWMNGWMDCGGALFSNCYSNFFNDGNWNRTRDFANYTWFVLILILVTSKQLTSCVNVNVWPLNFGN